MNYEKIGRIFGVMTCIMMIATIFGGVMNVKALPAPNVSNEIMFWDDFETDLSKWTIIVDPSTMNRVERWILFNYAAGYAPYGRWLSWFLPSEWSLHIKSFAIPDDVAYVISQTYSTADDYIIQFNFLFFTDINARFKVVDDGNILLTIDHNNDLYAYDGAVPVYIDTLAYPIWYSFEIKVHVGTNDYDVYFDDEWKGNFNTVSTPYNYLILGDDSYIPTFYGEGVWDNIKVAKLHQLSWDDNFDNGNIYDWTTVVSPPNVFEVSTGKYTSPLFSLHMVGQTYYNTAYGCYADGFTPYYDLPPNSNYEIQFQFLIPDIDNYRFVAMADGFVTLVVDDNWLRAFIDDSNIIDIVALPLDVWVSIELLVYPTTMNYDVYINTIYYGRFDFVDDPMFKKLPSNLFMGVSWDENHRHGEAFWDDINVVVNHPPELEWTGEYNYVDDGLHPEIGFKDVTTFEYRIKYIDIDDDPPDLNDPKVHITKDGSPIGGSPFIMDEVDPSDIIYNDGKLYKFSTILSDLNKNYEYHFTASDILGAAATPTPVKDAPDVIAFSGSESWWMFHHDERHTGYSTSIAPDSPTVMWTFETEHWIRSSPAIADGMVFFASLDHYVYAVDEFTGNEIWNFWTEYNVADSSPAVANGRVFIGCTDGKLYALDEFTGTELWNFPTAGLVDSSPVVANGKVFFGSCDDRIYALNEITGAIEWFYETDDNVDSSPAVADGMVFVGSWDGWIYALNENKGTLEWRYRTDDWVWSSPAVADGKVFVGSYDNKLYAINEFFGTLEWSQPTGDFIYSSPAVAYGKVFVGSWDGWVYAFNENNGAPEWSFQTDGHVLSSPAVADGKVFVASYDDTGNYGTIYALDESSGTQIWDYPLTGATIWSSPAVADGMVFIGSDRYSPSTHSYVYAFV